MMGTLAEKVHTDIARIKDAAASGATGGYTVAELDTALSAGTVDISKLQESLSFSSVAQKNVAKMIAEMNAARNSNASEVAIDFAEMSKKIESPGLVDAIKEIMEKELASADFEKELAAELEATQSKLSSTFSGPDGLYAKAKAEEKASDAGLLQCVADLELLEKQIEGVSEQTIAEILEQEPDLRKEVEAEIDNANWAP